jgi:hypothetical protein
MYETWKQKLVRMIVTLTVGGRSYNNMDGSTSPLPFLKIDFSAFLLLAVCVTKSLYIYVCVCVCVCVLCVFSASF